MKKYIQLVKVKAFRYYLTNHESWEAWGASHEKQIVAVCTILSIVAMVDFIILILGSNLN